MDFNTQDADDQDVFEIVDFTTASDWERFTAEIEEALHGWQLTSNRRRISSLAPGDMAKAEWVENSITIKFIDFPFKLIHHSILQNSVESPTEDVENTEDDDDNDETNNLPLPLIDGMNGDNDFPGRAHCLSRWYGLQEFIILSPSNSIQNITTPAKARLLQSSLSMAANNTNCQVPLFVQIMSPRDKMYLGIGYGHELLTHYDMVQLSQPPPQCTHMSGLLDILKSKLQISISSPPVTASVRFTYALSEWPHNSWTQAPPDFDATLAEVGFSDLGKLPFGASCDPVRELHISAMWPYLNEAMLVDNEVYSDLNPLFAPVWTAKIITCSKIPCLLSEYLIEFLTVCSNTHSVMQILGPKYNFEAEDDTDITSALSRLTEHPVPSLSSVMGRIRSRHKRKPKTSKSQTEQGPISNDILVPILNYLFPDADVEEPLCPYPSSFSQVPTWSSTEINQDHPFKTVFGNMKSSCVDGLVWRLGLVLCHSIHSLGGLRAAGHLWHEFVLELRFRWDNGILIPGLDPGLPDLGSSLIQQKIQMLNCCIQRKLKREDNLAFTGIEEVEEEDEFFECEEEAAESEDINIKATCHPAWDKPEGRLKRCRNLTLLNSADPLYIPVTQEAAPITEDILEEQADTLMGLGSDNVGSHLRARMMSSALLSDMESFKAANPGSVLEDFVRWYSPRDWIEEEDSDTIKDARSTKQTVTGHLSGRMQIPGNLWLEVWDNAKPVPARRQRRLFDDTREAEQVLRWLTDLQPGMACCYLLPTVLYASLARLSNESLIYDLPASQDQVLPQPAHSNTLSAQLDLIAQRIVRLSRQPCDVTMYDAVIKQLTSIEFSIACAQSVYHKLLGEPQPQKSCKKTQEEDDFISEIDTTMEKLILELLHGREVTVDDGPTGTCGKVFQNLFREAHKASQLLEDKPQDLNRSHRKSWSSISDNDNHMGKPIGREYLFRTTAPLPTLNSRIFPQRLFAVVQNNNFRLCGAFTEDTTFY